MHQALSYVFYADIISFEENVWEESPAYIAKPRSNSNHCCSPTPSTPAALPVFTDYRICGHSYSLWNIKQGYVSQSTAMHLIFFVFVTFWRPGHTALHLPRPQGPPLLFTPGPVNIWCFEKRSQNIDPHLPFQTTPKLVGFLTVFGGQTDPGNLPSSICSPLAILESLLVPGFRAAFLCAGPLREFPCLSTHQ